MQDFRIDSPAFFYYGRLRKLQQYVTQNLTRRLSLAEAAAVANLERKYFSTFFKEKVGVGYPTWIERVRIRAALQLIVNQDITLYQAARNTGFRSIRTFQRAFKRQTGFTPSQFRRSARRLAATKTMGTGDRVQDFCRLSEDEWRVINSAKSILL